MSIAAVKLCPHRVPQGSYCARCNPSTPVGRLAELERVVEHGLARFIEVGEALMEIRDARLYLSAHSNFEDYCRERWGFSREHGRRLIQAAAVSRELPPIGGSPANEAQVRELAPLLDEPEVLREAWAEVVERNPEPTAADIREVVQKRRASTVMNLKSSETDEWYTPPRYMEVARRFLGTIDLDPASHAVANELVQAARFFAIDDDGLAQEWRGRVWLNPPYGTKCPAFVAKLRDEYASGRVSEALLLVSAYSTETRWFQPLFDFPICFVDHRIKFLDSANASFAGSSTIGNAVVYFGDRIAEFVETFVAELGAVIQSVRRAA